MRGIIKRYHRARINRNIASNVRAIDASRRAGQEFAEREALYMRHHELIERRESL